MWIGVTTGVVVLDASLSIIISGLLFDAVVDSSATADYNERKGREVHR